MYSSENVEVKFDLFECFCSNLTGDVTEEITSKETQKKIDSLTLKEKKYFEKLQLQIVDTILIDNGQIVAWLFTDKNGYVMNHSRSKLNREAIINYYIIEIKKFLIDKLGIRSLSKINNEKMINDFEIFENSINLKTPPDILYKKKHCEYLIHFHMMKCILITYNSVEENSNKKKFYNVIEMNKILKNSNKLSSVKLIQFILDVRVFNHFATASKYVDLTRVRFQQMKIEYECNQRDNFKKKIKLYIENPKQIASPSSKKNTIPNLRRTLSKRFSTQSMINTTIYNSAKNMSCRSSLNSFSAAENNNNLANSNSDITNSNLPVLFFSTPLTPLNNSNLQSLYEKIIFHLVKHIENFKKITLLKCDFSFIKLNNENFAFVGGGFVAIGFDRCGEEFIEKRRKLKSAMDNLYKKRIPPDIHNFNKIKKIAEEHKCHGDFCDFVVPEASKVETKQNALNSILLHSKVQKENKFSQRDKDYTLPNRLSLFKIKQAYDNPSIVNMVLKAYSIFPKEANRELLSLQIAKEKDEINREKSAQIFSSKSKPSSLKISLFTDICKEIKERIILYKPKENKFENINFDNLYTTVGVCYNCFVIYSLINKYISTFDFNSMTYKNEAKAKSLLVQGEKFIMTPSTTNFSNDNTIYQGELNDECLRKSLMKTIEKKREQFIEDNRNGSYIKRLYKNRITRKEENKQMLNYYIDIGAPRRKIDINLKNEEIETKTEKQIIPMFNIHIKQEKKTNKKKICYKEGRSSSALMKNRRVHMGYTSSINLDIKGIRPSYAKSNSGSIMNLDIDIIHNLRNIRHSSSMSSLLSTPNDQIAIKKKNKIHLTSIFYSKTFEKVNKNIPYYNISSPIAKYKDGNHIVTNEEARSVRALLTSVTSQEYMKLAGIEPNSLLFSSDIFIYDNYTAVPFFIYTSPHPKSSQPSLIIFVINDFFDSYEKYSSFFYESLRSTQTNANIKIVFFNLPGQPYTLWSSNTKLNNAFYISFIDRFLFYLFQNKKAFDHTYSGFFVGFGNGAHIALSYLLVYEKFCSFIKGSICVNSFMKNDTFIKGLMKEILRKLKKNESEEDICSFIKNVCKSDEDENIIFKRNSLLDIIKGYHYNLDIKGSNTKKDIYGINTFVKDISCPVVFVNSVNDSFVNIENIKTMIDISKREYILEIDDIDKYLNYQFSFEKFFNGNDSSKEKYEDFYGKNSKPFSLFQHINNKPKRFFIKLNTDAHNLINFSNSTIHIMTNIIKCFFSDYVNRINNINLDTK